MAKDRVKVVGRVGTNLVETTETEEKNLAITMKGTNGTRKPAATETKTDKKKTATIVEVFDLYNSANYE